MQNAQKNLIVQADYGTATSNIIAYTVCILGILGIISYYHIWPLVNYAFYSGSRPPVGLIIAFMTVLILTIILLLFGIKNSVNMRKELPVIYTFTENGYTCHQSKTEYQWDDFDKFYFYGRSASLYADLKNKGGSVILNTSDISGPTCRRMIAHIKTCAPKELTVKL